MLRSFWKTHLSSPIHSYRGHRGRVSPAKNTATMLRGIPASRSADQTGDSLPSRPLPTLRSSCAFTLIELLVVIAIIGILAAISFAVYGRAQEAALMSKDTANLKAIGTAMALYGADHEQRFASAYWAATDTSFDAAILPYMGNSATAFVSPVDKYPRPFSTARSYGMNDQTWNYPEATCSSGPNFPVVRVGTPSTTLEILPFVTAGNCVGLGGFSLRSSPPTADDHSFWSYRNYTEAVVLWYDGHTSLVTNADTSISKYFPFQQSP